MSSALDHRIAPPPPAPAKSRFHADWRVVGLVGAVAVVGVGVVLVARSTRRATTPGIENPSRERDDFGSLARALDTFSADGPREQARRLYAGRSVAIETALRRNLDRAAAMKGVRGGWSAAAEALQEPAVGPGTWTQDDVWWAASQAMQEAFPELDAHHDAEAWGRSMSRSSVRVRSGNAAPETQSLAPTSAWVKGAVAARGMALTKAHPDAINGTTIGWRFFG